MSEEKICKKCGRGLENHYRVCPYCGSYQEVSTKSGIVCLLLCVFLGWIGGHRFYSGNIGSAIIMLILGLIETLYLFDENGLIDGDSMLVIVPIISLIWFIIDLITIAKGNFKDSKGRYIKIK